MSKAQQVPFVMPDRYTPIPDYFFDVVFPTLNGSELKALLYILRHTYGYQKSMDAISYSQFLHGIMRRDGKRQDAGAGLSERALVRALASLETQGHIQRLSAVGRATYYRPIAPENIRETPAVHPPKVPSHVPQPLANLAETRHTLQNTSLLETMQPAEPIEPIIAVLTSIGVQRATARTVAQQVRDRGKGRAYVQMWVDEAQARSEIRNKAGFVVKMLTKGYEPHSKTPPDEGGVPAWWQRYQDRAMPYLGVQSSV